MANYNTTPTDHSFIKALQALVGTSIAQGSTTNTNSTLCAPGSGRESSGKPDHISQIPIGLKFGYINRINLNSSSDYKYEVIFPDTDTKVWARRYGKSGETNTPAGTVVNGFLYPTEKVNVGLQIEYQSFTWAIIVEEELSINSVPNSKTFSVGNSKITFLTDSLKLECGNSSLSITNDGIILTSPSIKLNGVEYGGN